MAKFLSEVFALEDFSRNTINVLSDSTGSGKTTLAFNLINSIPNAKSLYLIDTTNGKESLLERKDTEQFTDIWKDYIQSKLIHLDDLKPEQVISEITIIFEKFQNKTVVMTYQQLGKLLQQYENFLKYLDIIILDEAHNLIKYFYMERGKLLAQFQQSNPYATKQQKSAYLDLTCSLYQVIKQLSNISQYNNYTIALSATPNKFLEFIKELQINVKQIQTDVELVSYENLQTKYYSNLEIQLLNLPENEKAIVYIPNIIQMKKMQNLINSRTNHNAIAIWSIHNKQHQMSQFQLNVREHIKVEKNLPEEISILIINKSYETSINIYDEEIHNLIIHTSEDDTITQIRGRLRQDLPLLLLKYKANKEFEIKLDEKWLNRKLFAEQQEKLVEEINLTLNNRKVGIRKIVNILQKQNNYKVYRGNTGKKRYISLTKIGCTILKESSNDLNTKKSRKITL